MPEAVAGLLSAPRGKIKLITFKKSSKRRLYTKRFCCSAQNVGADMSVNRIVWLLREPDSVKHLCDSHIWFHSASFISSLPLSVSDPPSVSIEGYDNNWYVGRSGAVLLCQANANPPPTNVTWTA